MERLTERVGDYIRIKGCKTLYHNKERKGAHAHNAVVRLYAHEDAEEQGWLVRLPCKVGDTVYTLFCDEVVEKRIGRFIINGYTNPALWVELDCDFLSSVTERWDIGIGGKFFLTREEAEAALKEANQNG